MKKIHCLLMILMTVSVCACIPEGQSSPPPAKNVQAQKAQAAANSITFTENAEIDNIKKRLELTANPGLLGFVVLLNETGQPVMHCQIKGKITSGSKRLTKPYDVRDNWDLGQVYGDKELPSASDEGTYGSSGEYIFFWTTAGQYIQWNGKYLYSDKPFRLNIDPIVVSTAAAQ